MDQALKRKMAPRRDMRRAHFVSVADAVAQASALEWRTNEYDFYRLCRCVFDSLDSRYREFGFRVDQLVSFEEFRREARRHIEIYDQERLGDCIDVFRYLYASFDVWLGGRANAALDRRLEVAEEQERYSRSTITDSQAWWNVQRAGV